MSIASSEHSSSKTFPIAGLAARNAIINAAPCGTEDDGVDEQLAHYTVGFTYTVIITTY